MAHLKVDGRLLALGKDGRASRENKGPVATRQAPESYAAKTPTHLYHHLDRQLIWNADRHKRFHSNFYFFPCMSVMLSGQILLVLHCGLRAGPTHLGPISGQMATVPIPKMVPSLLSDR